MKDEDIEILLDSVKDLERTLSNVEQKVLNTEAYIKNMDVRQKRLRYELHEMRLNIDSKYAEDMEGYEYTKI